MLKRIMCFDLGNGFELLARTEYLLWSPKVRSQCRPSFLHLETLRSSIACVVNVFSYRWTFNDAPFDPSGTDGRISIQPGSGILRFAQAIARDEGRYQCEAYNVVGVALSDKVNLRRGSEFIFVITDSLCRKLWFLCRFWSNVN